MRPLVILTVTLSLFFTIPDLKSQTNIFISNPIAFEILKGDYNPDEYRAKVTTDKPDSVRMGIIGSVDPIELTKLLVKLESFYNRNSGADTLSETTGIGACRSWILSEFDKVSKNNDNRLVTGYLEFDARICSKTHHKNPFALLPGMDTSNHEILVIEGHFDTRNEGRCDTTGYTPGMDDNGSGTVLVMELARIMSKYSFRRTILFTTPTGEDEGLWGAKAWAEYLSAHGIKVKSVLNNDIVGGIYCGNTSSPPSCIYGSTDSTHVRVFSFSQGNDAFAISPHKQLVRYMKYVQDDLINPYLVTPLFINIMIGEDRKGRGGDHTPFRQKGYTAVRIISANEHGNGTGKGPDRNHTTRDVLGKDLNGDGILDSLFVNPGYLARNAILNGVVTGLLASSPEKVVPILTVKSYGAMIELPVNKVPVDGYLVGIRKLSSNNLEFDTILKFKPAKKLRVNLKSGEQYFISISPVYQGAPGIFSDELKVNLSEK